MAVPTELSIEIHYEKREDGRYFLASDDVPGFRLVGGDWNKLQADLDPVVKDLLFHNLGFSVKSIRWVPSPDDVKRHFEAPQHEGKATYVARLKVAA